MAKILPGHFNLRSLFIISEEGRKIVDLLTKKWTQIHIFESILTPTITGYISFTDHENIASGVASCLPIMGNEILYLEAELPNYFIESPRDGSLVEGKPNIIRYIGRITDIKARDLINDRSQNYEIHFASEELVLDRNLIISKSFKGKRLSEIAESIFSRFSSITDSEWEATAGTHDIIIPSWNPLKAINWLATRSISEAWGPGPMLFFQTLYADDVLNNEEEIRDNQNLKDFSGEVASKYWFLSLNYLLSWAPRKILRFFPAKTDLDPTTQDGRRDYMKFSNVLNYRFLESFDVIESNRLGLFNGNLITHDITTKTWKLHTYNYDLDFENHTHTEKPTPGRLYSGNRDILGNTFTSPAYVDSLGLMVPTGTPESPNRLEKISLVRSSRLASLMHGRIEVLLPGDGLIESGDVISFAMPSPEPNAEVGLYDEFYSGNYLVTAMRHIFTKSEYRIQLDLSKETLKSEPRGYTPK